MLTLLSPAKKQKHNTMPTLTEVTEPAAHSHIKKLVMLLKKYGTEELSELMSISEKLAELNYSRYQNFDSNNFTQENSTPAVYAFQGDAYQTLNVGDFNKKELEFMQKHLMILSGLYGYLKPMDLIQLYRLEMKTPLKTELANDLYHFWRDAITEGINKALESQKNKMIINLASNEYFKSINPNKLNAGIIHIQFKEIKNGVYKTIGINAKRARGMMTRFIMKNYIDQPDLIKDFSESNYCFSKEMSSENIWVFIR